jgi:hypothetical protein
MTFRCSSASSTSDSRPQARRQLSQALDEHPATLGLVPEQLTIRVVTVTHRETLELSISPRPAQPRLHVWRPVRREDAGLKFGHRLDISRARRIHTPRTRNPRELLNQLLAPPRVDLEVIRVRVVSPAHVQIAPRVSRIRLATRARLGRHRTFDREGQFHSHFQFQGLPTETQETASGISWKRPPLPPDHPFEVMGRLWVGEEPPEPMKPVPVSR